MPTKETNLDSFLPFPKEKKDNKSIRETEYCETWLSLVESTPKNDTVSPPCSWHESIGPDNAQRDLSNVEHFLASAPTCISNNHDLTNIFNSCGGNLVIATIASGNKSSVQLYHNLDQVGTSTVGLHGFGSLASPQLIDTSRLLDTKFSPIPDVETIANIPPQSRSTHQVPTNDQTMTPVSNAIILPTRFAHNLISINFDGSPNTLLTNFMAFLESEDENKGIETYVTVQDTVVDSDEDDEDINTTSMTINPKSNLIRYAHAIQSMYRWETQSRATQNCSSPTDDEGIVKWTTLRHDSLAIKKPANLGPQLKTRPRSPSKPDPMIILTGKEKGDDIRTSLEHQFNNEDNELTSTPLDTQQRLVPPISDQTYTTKPDGESPFTTTSSRLQTLTNNSTLDLSSPENRFTEALTCLLNATEKNTYTNERMVEAQEAMVKLKEKSDKNKISDPTKDYIKNIFTTDGENQLTEVPPKLSALMTTSLDTTAANLELELHGNRTPGNPSVSLVKAIHKGQYHHQNGHPNNFCPLNMTYSIISASSENMDLQSLLAAEEKGSELTSEEKAAISASNKLTPPRTIAFSIKMINAYVTVLKLGGEDSLIYLSTQDFAQWMMDHEETLGENSALYDNKLPTKILYAVGDALNNYYKESRFTVPNQHWLDFEPLKRNILSNQYSITLPHSVTQAFDGKKRAREERNGKDNRGDSKRAVVQHQNQPIPLKTSKDTHATKITPYLRTENVSVPKNNNEEECLRWCFLGYCNSNCQRKGNHTPVKNGSSRCKKLVDFKKKAISHADNNNNNNNNNNGQQNLE